MKPCSTVGLPPESLLQSETSPGGRLPLEQKIPREKKSRSTTPVHPPPLHLRLKFFVNFDCTTRINFNCSPNGIFTICILHSAFTTRRRVNVEGHQNNFQTPRIFGFEIPWSATDQFVFYFVLISTLAKIHLSCHIFIYTIKETFQIKLNSLVCFQRVFFGDIVGRNVSFPIPFLCIPPIRITESSKRHMTSRDDTH